MIKDDVIYSLDLEVYHYFPNKDLNCVHYYTLIRKTGLECKFLIHDLGIDYGNVSVGKRIVKSCDFAKNNMVNCITIKIVKNHNV